MRTTRPLDPAAFTRRALPALALMILAIVPSLDARDLYDPLVALDPLYASGASRETLLPNVYGAFDYVNYALLHGEEDSFHLTVDSASALFSLPRQAAFGLRFSSILMAGPIAAGDKAASIMEFWLNAVQFEYGLYGSIGLDSFHLLLEYSRTSQHPLRPNFSQAAADILGFGLVTPEYSLEGARLTAWVRTLWRDLYEFWGSNLPKPRAWLAVAPAFLAHWRLDGGLRPFVFSQLDLLALRSGAYDLDATVRAGLFLGEGTNLLQFYTELYRSGDSEVLDGRETPTLQWGFGIRSSTGELPETSRRGVRGR